MKIIVSICLAIGLVMTGETVNLSASPRSIFLTFNGIGGGNMNGSPTRIDAPFVGVDGDHFNPFLAYFTTAATSSAPGTFRLRWYESLAQNGMASTMFAFRSAP